jgi:hypothetical protein
MIRSMENVGMMAVAPAMALALHSSPEAATEPITPPLVREVHVTMPYAPDFANDPAATHLSMRAQHQLRGFVEEIPVATLSDGPSRIEVTGWATPDDNAQGNAGIDKRSKENQRLATLRGQTVAGLLRPLLHGNVTVVVMPGKEPVLSPEQTQTLAGYAYDLNYPDTAAMLRDWRAGELRYKQPTLNEVLKQQIGAASVTAIWVPKGQDRPTSTPNPFGFQPWPNAG